MPYARTLDSATLEVHKVFMPDTVILPITEVAIRNKCYVLNKDASEDVVAFNGELRDFEAKVRNARYMRSLDKGPTHVRTSDFDENDIIVAHYHCGIAPEPSAIDLNTMKNALRFQLLATVPGRPRIYGILAPKLVGMSFCVDIAFFEPLPEMTIGYEERKLESSVDFDTLKEARKGFVEVMREGNAYLINDLCDFFEDECYPFRYGDTFKISPEDFIFIASYHMNTKRKEFLYMKITTTRLVAYEVKVSNFNPDGVVIRGLPWTFLRASTRELQST